MNKYLVSVAGAPDYWFEAESDEDAKRGILVDLVMQYPNGVPEYTVYRMEEV